MQRGKKAKTIRKILREEFGSFVESISDERVQGLVRRNSIITGGSIASLLLGEDVNDFDIYFTNLETALAVAEHYTADLPNAEVKVEDGKISVFVQSSGMAGKRLDDVGEQEHDEDPEKRYQPCFVTSNAITLHGSIQLILRFYGDPEAIHANYDFVHCTNYWLSGKDELVINQAALESLLARELVYQGSLFPVCSLIRVRKFVSRGWVITAGQMLKMILQAAELDLTDPAVLEDQLVGVDTAYFLELIENIRETNPEKINAQYIGEMIDRIF